MRRIHSLVIFVKHFKSFFPDKAFLPDLFSSASNLVTDIYDSSAVSVGHHMNKARHRKTGVCLKKNKTNENLLGELKRAGGVLSGENTEGRLDK